jgi:hypothetical protein
MGDDVVTPTVVIDWLNGYCPVQAEGTIDGRRFYFRARGEHWSIEVHPTATGEFLDWPDYGHVWMYREPWGDMKFAAGWMPDDVAREMIAKAAVMYRAVRERENVGV